MKSTDAQVRQFILQPMMDLYTPPRSQSSPEAALRAYMAALAPYPPEALQGGWVALVAAHDRTTWPVPAEIIKHVRDWIHNNVKTDASTVRRDDKGDAGKRFPDNAARAMATRDGQMALQHGYGRILYQHVERNGWLEGFDHAAAKALDTEMREVIAEMERNGDDFGGAYLTMGKRRLETEHDLRTKHLKRDAAE